MHNVKPFTFIHFIHFIHFIVMASLSTDSAVQSIEVIQSESPTLKREPSSGGATFNIVCFGDSLTEGYSNFGRSFQPYSDSLRDELNNVIYNGDKMSVTCESIGFSGYTTDELRQKMNKHQATFLDDVDLILVMAGTNDIGLGLNFFDTIENIQSIHQSAWSRGIDTVAMTIPESRVTVRPGEYQNRRKALNEAIQTDIAVVEKDLCHFIDIGALNPFNDEQDAEGNYHWDNDGLHMTAAGYAKFGKLLAPLLKPIIDNIKANMGFEEDEGIVQNNSNDADDDNCEGATEKAKS
jgi:lysophospholipase L1-like esterase